MYGLGAWVVLPFIHSLAALFWAGSMIFFAAVLTPVLRGGLGPQQRRALIRALAPRYRAAGWASVGLLLITGAMLAWRHGVVWASDFGRLLILKLLLVGVMLALTLYHDLALGPRMARALESGTPDPHAAKTVSAVARLNLLVVVFIILCGLLLAAA